MKKCLIKKEKDLASSGIGIERTQSEIITVTDKDDTWKKGIRSTDTADLLRDTLFFLLEHNFVLRGGVKHYNLRYGENSHLKLGKKKDFGRIILEYTEDVSKCNSGGIHHWRLKKAD